MEEGLGAELLYITTKHGVRLASAGRQNVGICRNMFWAWGEAEQAVQGEVQGQKEDQIWIVHL